MGPHAFTPSTRETKTGVIWLGRERNRRPEKRGVHCNLRQQSEAVSLRMQSEDRIAPLV